MALSRPRIVFGLIVVWALIFGTVGGVTEWILRSRYLRIARSDQLQQGMTVSDRTLGWRLQPSWRGRHQHNDFDVSYTINPDGFRGVDARAHPSSAQRLAFVGDSFTFGIGVNDDALFTEVLTRRRPLTRRIYNYAVPGYSTDQEVLLAEQHILSTRPDVLVLLVYLANDLFDNQLSMPLQVPRHKPRFVLKGTELVLTNSPVPGGQANRLGQPNLLDMILGHRPDPAESSRAGPSAFANATADRRSAARGGWFRPASWRQQLEGRSRLFQMLSENVLPAPSDDAAFDERFAPALALFWALVDRLQAGCTTSDTRCAIALMSGRSFVESPSSLSAQFQDYFRRRIISGGQERRIDVIDLAGELKGRHEQLSGEWFHPNEGHLNATGHRVVADILEDAITRLER